jgi:hypothetical protein
LFHRHNDTLRDRQGNALNGDELEQLAGRRKIRGLIVSTKPSADDPTRSIVGVSVRLQGGKTVEFSEAVAKLYQPEPGSADAQQIAEVREAQQVRHPGHIPKIQLPISLGSSVPVRYSAGRLEIDGDALRRKALEDYIERESGPASAPSPAAPRAVAGPPWEVPSTCPTCGAPVDQATSSRSRDPRCLFCREPLPVQPLARP